MRDKTARSESLNEDAVCISFERSLGGPRAFLASQSIRTRYFEIMGRVRNGAISEREGDHALCALVEGYVNAEMER